MSNMVVSNWKRFFFSAIVFVCLVVVVSYLCVTVYSHLSELSFWKIRSISVEGNKVLNRKQILDTVGVVNGAPIWSFKLVDIRERLEEMTWIDRAEVRWDFPGRLYVRVYEKAPFMSLCSCSGCYYVDKDGVLFDKCKECSYARFKLVVNSLDNVISPEDNRRVRVDFMDKFRMLLKVLAKNSRLCSADIMRIDYDEEKGFSIETGSIKAVLGTGDFESKFGLLYKVTEVLENLKEIVDINRIDLRYKRYILVGYGSSGKE